MRVLLRALSGVGYPGEREHLDRALPRVLPAHAGVDAGDLSDLIADRKNGIERRHRLLEDHRDAVASNVADLFVAQGDDVPSLELDVASGLDDSRRLDQAKNRESGDGFSAARLADDADRLSCTDVERHAIHGARDARLSVEPGPEIANGEEGRRHRWSAPIVGVAQRFTEDVQRHHRENHEETGKE